MIGFIYTLTCPKSGNVIYVGSTTKPLRTRYFGHTSQIGINSSPLYSYMYDVDVVPVIELLEEVKAR